MSAQTRIALFCYAYVAGIVASLFLMLDHSWQPVVWVGFVLALILSLAYYSRFWRVAGPVSSIKSECIWLILPAFFLGLGRHMQVNTVPDARLGVLKVTPTTAQFRLERDLPDLSRIAVRKISELKGDLVLRVVGELDVRIAVTNSAGLPQIDERGRWMFQVVHLSRTSDPVVVRQWDPVGTEYVVPQPFSRIHTIEILEMPGSAEVAVYRLSNHIGSFARPGRDFPPVTILGRVTKDPDVYEFKTILTVSPDFIQTAAGGPYFAVEGGEVAVVATPEISTYAEFARTEAYGRYVVVHGELMAAQANANPGGFNPRQYMQNHNVYGIVRLFQPPNHRSPLLAVDIPSERTPQGHPLVRFSLRLRDRMLRVFKLTMPFPQSAFLGGVTLGLRYGLQGIECLLSASRASAGEDPASFPKQCREWITEEFRASGVNHVLAVSGLHVTIVTVMFMGLFALLRIPRTLYVPLILVILTVFAIITGARPSVLRAVIMHGLFLITWAYFGQGLRASVLLGVPVAAFLILLQNPLVLTDASFTLSFGAILSLGVLTQPIYDLLAQLRGNRLVAFALIVLGTTIVGMVQWPLLVSNRFWPIWFLGCGILWWLLAKAESRGIKLIGDFGYSDIPPSVGAFLAAQFGIQIGMMVPLSAYYFSRWPFAGAYANLLAIPLIGVVVQLGVLAGLVGLLPQIGLYLALVLNAANWVFSSVFLLVAHVFSAAFPFPFVRKPSLGALLTYYLLLAAFIWRTQYVEWMRRWWESRHPPSDRAVRVLACLGLLFLTIPAWPWLWPPPKGKLQITVLSLGYGDSLLIETPAGRRILVDAGFVERERGRRNDALRTILPFLSHKRIRHLDFVLLTSPAPERLSGLAYILEHCSAGTVYLPPALRALSLELEPEAFFLQLSGNASLDMYSQEWLNKIYNEAVGARDEPRRLSLAKQITRNRNTWVDRWSGRAFHVRFPETGEVILRESWAGKEFRLEAVSVGIASPEDHPIENRSCVYRIVYGDFACLITGDLHFAGQRELTRDSAIRSHILVFPHHGTATPWVPTSQLKEELEEAWRTVTQPFLAAVRPRHIIFTYGNPRPVLGRASREAERAFEITWGHVSQAWGVENCFRTDRDMAIFVVSDGVGYEITTQAKLHLAAGAEETPAELDAAF